MLYLFVQRAVRPLHGAIVFPIILLVVSVHFESENVRQFVQGWFDQQVSTFKESFPIGYFFPVSFREGSSSFTRVQFIQILFLLRDPTPAKNY